MIKMSILHPGRF